MVYLQWVIAVGVGYLCGSIPFGLMIGLSKGVDLRKLGSGNIGATNCGRVLGKKYGLVCFALDLMKGMLPVLGAGWWFGLLNNGPSVQRNEEWLWLLTGVAAILGHIYPIWLNFRGGKGVATGFGVILGLWPHMTFPALGAVLTWLLFASTLRYSGLASITAAVTMPCYLLAITFTMGRPLDRMTPYLLASVAMSGLILIRHRGNFQRLRLGTESRLGG